MPELRASDRINLAPQGEPWRIRQVLPQRLRLSSATLLNNHTLQQQLLNASLHLTWVQAVRINTLAGSWLDLFWFTSLLAQGNPAAVLLEWTLETANQVFKAWTPSPSFAEAFDQQLQQRLTDRAHRGSPAAAGGTQPHRRRAGCRCQAWCQANKKAPP